MMPRFKIIYWALAGALVIGALIAPSVGRSETRNYTGAINQKLKIRMSLSLDGPRVTGSYYYEKYKKDIRLAGSIDTDLKITLTEYDPAGRSTGSFLGRYVSDRRIEGTWVKPDGSKSYPFHLVEHGPGSPPPSSGPLSLDPATQKFLGTWLHWNGKGTLTLKSDGSFAQTFHNPDGSNFSKEAGKFTVQDDVLTLKYNSGTTDDYRYVYDDSVREYTLQGEYIYVKTND